MTFRSILAAAALSGIAAMAAGVAAAQTAPAAPASDADLRRAFDAADNNRDGVVDVDEAVADAVLIFITFDKNRDRHLTPDELPRHNPERVRRADRDGDGKLSVGEVASDRVWEFFEADVDRNGVLTFEEVRVYVAKTRGASR